LWLETSTYVKVLILALNNYALHNIDNITASIYKNIFLQEHTIIVRCKEMSPVLMEPVTGLKKRVLYEMRDDVVKVLNYVLLVLADNCIIHYYYRTTFLLRDYQTFI